MSRPFARKIEFHAEQHDKDLLTLLDASRRRSEVHGRVRLHGGRMPKPLRPPLFGPFSALLTPPRNFRSSPGNPCLLKFSFDNGVVSSNRRSKETSARFKSENQARIAVPAVSRTIMTDSHRASDDDWALGPRTSTLLANFDLNDLKEPRRGLRLDDRLCMWPNGISISCQRHGIYAL